MTTYSIIQKSQLEGALRLDAEYYQPEYLKFFEKIRKFNIQKLGEVANILRGNTPKEYGEYEIPIIRSGDLSNFFINEELLQAKNESIFYLKKGDILISSIGLGSIGKVNIFTGVDNRFGTVAEVTVVRDSKVNPFYIWAFLRSKFGQFQIEREITGATGQLHLNVSNVENILIPLIKNIKEFERLYKEAENLYQKSKDYYSQAENLLLEELGLKDFKIEDDLSYIVNLSQIKSAHRADAEYFQPKYEGLINMIKCQKERLHNLLSSKIKKGIEVGEEEYQEGGKLFIRVSNLLKQGLVERDQKYISEELYQRLRKNFEPKVGEILLTKDATPGIAYVVKEPIEGIIASGIVRLKIKEEIESEYLTLVINTIVGQYQVERDIGGSVILHWRPEQIENLLIPILPKPTQQKIADLVQKSHKARKKAKELLESAKRKVEELIERSVKN